MDNTQEIDLIDLMRRIVRRWKYVLVMMLIFAVLFDALACLKSVRDRNNYVESDMMQEQENIEEKYGAILSDSEMSEVKLGAEAYITYLKRYATTVNYNNDSILMNLDAESVPTVRLQYYVDTHYVVEYPVIEKKDNTAAIVGSYINKLKSIPEDVLNMISEELGYQVDAGYIEELICIENNDDNDVADGNITITIFAKSEEDCRTIVDHIESYIEDATKDISKVYGDYDITLVQEEYYVDVNTDLLARQQQQITAVNSLRNTAYSLSNAFTEDQKAYYRALVNEMLSEDEALDVYNEEILVEEGIQESEKITTSAPEIIYVSKKYVAIGLMVGMMIACCWITIKYICSHAIKTTYELSKLYNLSELGIIKTKAKTKHSKKGPQFTEEERISMICAGIKISAQKGELKEIYVTGSCNDEESERIKALILDGLKKCGIAAKVGNTIVYDPESLELVASSDGVVLVERVDYSLYNDIQKEVELCKRYDVEIIGAVGIE